MRNLSKIIFSVLFLGIFIGCAGSKKKEEVKVPVQVTKVSYGDVMQTLKYTGEIQAEYEVKVFSKIPDRIEEFYVDVGSRVGVGTPIAKIYAATIEQAVRQAEGALAGARAHEANLFSEFERAQRLFRENAMSKQQFDAIQTQFEAVKAQREQAEAALASVKEQLDNAVVKAPISGIIGERYYQPGDMANPAMPLVRIVQMERVKLILNVAEQDLGKIARGQDVVVYVRSYPDHSFKGKVYKVSPVLDSTTRLAKIEVLVPNPGYLLKPGMFGEAEIHIGVLKNVLTVPKYVTIENTSMENIDGRDQVVKKYFVFVVGDSDKVEQRPIQVMYMNDVNVAVASGLQPGETIVVSGQASLRDGMTVTMLK